MFIVYHVITKCGIIIKNVQYIGICIKDKVGDKLLRERLSFSTRRMRRGLRQKKNRKIKVVGILIGITVIYIILSLLLKNGAGGNGIFFAQKYKYIDNAWLISSTDSTIKVFYDGKERELKLSNKLEKEYSNIICNLKLEDDEVSKIAIKPSKVTGKVLSISDEYVEIDGYGRVDLTGSFKIFEMYDGINEIDNSDVTIGTEKIDYVLEDDKVCAILINEKSEINEYIKVIIKTNNYDSIFHNKVVLSSKEDMTVKYLTGDKVDNKKYVEKTIKAGSKLTINEDSDYDKYSKDRIIVSVKSGKSGIKINSVDRSSDDITYKGNITIAKYNDGYVIINNVNVEDYLCAVVPSEMPSSYGMEALKAQAVCARTYAYMQMNGKKYKKYGADVDDSTSYQVYNNQTNDEEAKKAVYETKGKVMTYNKKLITAYYYSTSSGYTSSATEVFSGKFENKTTDKYIKGKLQSVDDTIDTTLTKEADFKAFIDGDTDCFEKECSWYRWKVTVSDDDISRQINNNIGDINEDYLQVLDDGEYVNKSVSSVGTVKSIKVAKRLTGGLVTELIVEGTKNTIKVLTQHYIRTLLTPLYDKIEKNNGKSVEFGLLPSAYFYINKGSGGYTFVGGGFGHGAGMSQDGAMKLDKLGKKYDEILNFYYENVQIVKYN